MRNTILTILFYFVAFTGFAIAQGDDVINVDSTIVRLNVGVVNRTGLPITDLQSQDFAIYEDGKEQKILRFEPTVAPFSVVMILDMSGSTLGFRQTIQTSAMRFIDALAPDDRVAVIEFYDKVNVLNNFTSDRRTLFHSVEAAGGRGKTQLYKSLDLALKKLSDEKNRRRAIIVLTDGIDTELRNQDRQALSQYPDAKMKGAVDPNKNKELNAIITRASEMGVTIYPLALPTGNPKNIADPLPIQVEMYDLARNRLDILARRTGGTLNAINRLEEMGKLYAEIAADVRSLYTIEYEPENESRDGKWREIRIEVKKPHLISRTRPGYYAN